MKNILIIGFGGTIAMTPDSTRGGVLRPAKTIDEILTLVPTLRGHANITLKQILNIDSTNVNPSHWAMLAIAIADSISGYDAIIVTHGTDTMAYTATAISFAIGSNPPIPIIFTGSQLPLVEFGTDARFNLENAVKTAIHASEMGVNEVMIVFNDRVLRASRAIKSSEARFTAFESPAFPDLAQITAVGVRFYPQTRKKEADGQIDLKPHFQRGILTVDLVPGIEPSILSAVLTSGTCQGLLLKSLGAGNVPSLDDFSLIPIIKKAKTLGIPVLVSTKFVGGNTRMDLYEPGKEALDAGAIGTYDMTDVGAQVKLMWALGQGHRSSEALRKVIGTNYVGEVTL
ncbi:MAG: asparaginase [Patescibacteria group bacterium]